MAESQFIKILEWLKRNFTLNLFVAVITVISAWFSYDQYRRANGGKVIPVIFSNYHLDGDYKDFIIITTGDSIKISYPQIAPFYLNYSDYPIENVNVNYKIECPIHIDVSPTLDLNDGFNVRTQTFDSSNVLEWSFDYNKTVLFPNETTPVPFKYINVNPNVLKDSLFNYFDIYSYIVFNGKKSKIFKSRVHLIKYTERSDSLSYLDSLNNTNFFKWARGACKDLKNKVTAESDYLFAYHTFCNKGAFSHLKNINPTDLDSLSSNSQSSIFLRHHLYNFNEEMIPRNSINWVLTGIGFLIFILFGFIAFGAFKNWKEKQTVVIFFSLSVMCLCFSYNLFQTVLRYFNFELLPLNIAIYSVGIISTLYPFFIGFINVIKNIRSNSSNKSMKYLFIALLSYFILIEYVFVSELLQYI